MSAQKIHEWIASQGADPGKIYVQWDDNEITQKQAQEWLQQP